MIAFASAFVFSSEPIDAEVRVGAELARKGRSIQQALGANRVVLGRWFDGNEKREVEEAVLITPGLASRWLGHIGRSDSTEVYRAIAKQQHGRVIAFIRLARLNTIDFADGDEVDTAKPEMLDGVKIEFGESTSKRTPPTWAPVVLTKIEDRLDRHPHDFFKVTWDQLFSRAMTWPTPNGVAAPDPLIRWGRNRVVSYIAELPFVPKTPFAGFRITEPDRVRTVTFEVPKS